VSVYWFAFQTLCRRLGHRRGGSRKITGVTYPLIWVQRDLRVSFRRASRVIGFGSLKVLGRE